MPDFRQGFGMRFGLLFLVFLMVGCEPLPIDPPQNLPDPPLLISPTDGGRIGTFRSCPVPARFTWRHGGFYAGRLSAVAATHFLICVYREDQRCEWAQLSERHRFPGEIGKPNIPDHIWGPTVDSADLDRQPLGRSEIVPAGASPVALYSFEAPFPGLHPSLQGLPDLSWNVAACTRSPSGQVRCNLAEPHALNVDTVVSTTGEPSPCELGD